MKKMDDNCQKTYNLILYVIDNISIPTSSVISKVCYLCDYACMKNLGHPVSNIEYEKTTLGPIGKRIDDYLNDLFNSQKVNCETRYTNDGAEYVRYSVPARVHETNAVDDSFEADELLIIDEILSSVGSLNAQLLTKVTEKTPPIKKITASNQHISNQLIDLSVPA